VETQVVETQVAEERRIIALITRKLIPFLILLYIVAYIDRSTLGFAKLQMSVDARIGDAAYGMGAGLFFLGYFLFEVPSSLFLTRVGARRWFARILLTWGAVTIAMSAIHNAHTFYVLRFLLGSAEAGFYPGVVFYLTQWFPRRHLARIFGFFLLSQPGALIITGPLSGYLLGMEGVAGLHGWQWLFILSGIPAVLLALPTLRYLSDTPSDAKWLSDVDRGWLERELEQDRRANGIVEHGNPLRALADRRVLLLSLYFLPFPLAIYGLSLWLPTIIAGFGVTNITNGFLSIIPYIFAVIGLCVVPASSDRRRERYGHIAMCAGCSALGLILSASTSSHTLQLAALCITGFGLYSGQAVLWTLPGRFLTGATAATGIAVINSVGNLGGYIGPFAVGAIKEHTGKIANGLYFLGAVMLTTIATGLLVRTVLEPADAKKRRLDAVGDTRK
jgi:MFS family permease